MSYFTLFDFTILLDTLYIVFYVFMWITMLYLYQRERKTFDAGSFLLSAYSIYALSSLFLYYDSYYGEDFHNLSIFPFIYLFFMLYLTAKPVLNYNTRKIDRIECPNMLILNVVSVIFIISSLLALPSIFQGLTKGLALMMVDESHVQELYADSADLADSAGHGINNLRSIISGALTEFGIMLVFYYFTLEQKSKYLRYIAYGLLCSVFVCTFGTISLGQRGLMIETFLLILATYFLFKNVLPTKLNKAIRIIGVIFASFVFSLFVLMTVNRFSNNGDREVMSTVYYYAGEENLIFNKYAFNNNGIRYGDRTFPLFKKLLGFPNVPNNYIERREKYNELKVNDEVFITHIGDFLLDFGPILGTILILVISSKIIELSKVHDRKVKFHQLILIHATLYLCVIGGLKLYPFSDVGGNLKLIVYAVLYMTFRIDYDMRIVNKRKRINNTNEK